MLPTCENKACDCTATTPVNVEDNASAQPDVPVNVQNNYVCNVNLPQGSANLVDSTPSNQGTIMAGSTPRKINGIIIAMFSPSFKQMKSEALQVLNELISQYPMDSEFLEFWRSEIEEAKTVGEMDNLRRRFREESVLYQGAANSHANDLAISRSVKRHLNSDELTTVKEAFMWWRGTEYTQPIHQHVFSQLSETLVLDTTFHNHLISVLIDYREVQNDAISQRYLDRLIEELSL